MDGGERNYLLRGRWEDKMKKERQVARRVLTIMRELEKRYVGGVIPVDVVVTAARKKRIPAGRLEEAIIILKTEGILYSPSRGRLRITPSSPR